MASAGADDKQHLGHLPSAEGVDKMFWKGHGDCVCCLDKFKQPSLDDHFLSLFRRLDLNLFPVHCGAYIPIGLQSQLMPGVEGMLDFQAQHQHRNLF